MQKGGHTMNEVIAEDAKVERERRQREWAIALAWLTLGVFIGGIVVFAVFEHNLHQITDAADQSIAALKASNYAWEKTARDCTAQFSMHTLLIEDPRLDQNTWSTLPVPGALGFLLQSLNQQSPNRQPSIEGWYVPAKVTPVAYGTGARRYWWVDPKEKRLYGPYAPMRNTGLVQ